MSSEFVDISTIDMASRTAEWRAVEAIYNGRFCVEKASRSDKFFILKSAADPSDLIAISLLHKEFELTYHLDHPSIRRAYGIEKIEGVGDTLVLEYIDGRPLDSPDVVRLPKLARQKIVADLLSAVDYLHSRQIIHRDLKPENILITFNGHNVKLIDLGFSDADNFSALKSPAGTDGYMAPEQRRGEPLDTQADIYSLGVIFQRCFADIVPRSICRRCVEEDTAKRYASAHQLTEEIEQHAKGKRLIVRLVVVCFIVGMLAAAYLALRQGQPTPPIDLTPKIDTVIVEIPSVSVDTVVVEKPISPPKSKKQKSHPVSQKVEGGYTVVAPYPNAVEGYSINELGAIANKTIDQINQILHSGERFDTPEQMNDRFLPLAEENFKGIPHTIQKQMVLDAIERLGGDLLRAQKKYEESKNERERLKRERAESKKNREKVTGDSISKIK